MITVADSIGIKLLSPDCLLTGVGNELHQYYLDSSNQTVHRQISLNFRSKIYGISSFDEHNESDSQYVVVHGGREVAIFILSIDKHLKLVTHLTLSDWISSIKVYKPISSEEVSFCVLSAHSVASKLNVNINGKWRIEHKASCTDKCTLYCSFIIGNDWAETTIFGGTAFGELIIWNASGSGLQREVLHRLSGHNGVIFSINCSLANNLITTTSDDRSVKVWKLQFPPDAPRDWRVCSIEPTKSMFGHTARIFSHKIIEYNGKVYIISVGEDSNVCVWSPDGHLISRQPMTSSVSLWNLDYDSTRQYLFACGNDGNVHQSCLQDILNGTQYLCENIEIQYFGDGEYVDKLVIMEGNGIVVMLTNKRKLFYGKVEDTISQIVWKPLPDAEIGYKITVLETYESLVATAGYAFVTMYQFKNGQFNKVYHDQLAKASADSSPLLRSLQFLTEMEFVICDARGNGSLILIDETFNVIKNQPFQMPPSKERWITVAARFESYLVIGDRFGNMHLYIEIADTLNLKHTLWHVHGNLGCKTIFRTTMENPLQFKCAGHQSRVKKIAINATTQELELISTHDIPIKWCEKSLHIDKHRNILLAGFNERHFIAWRIDNSYRFEFECGGGHRAWALYIDRRTSKVYLFFIRSKLMNCVQFYLHDSTLQPFTIPKNNWHSRPCNTMRIIQLISERHLIVSGGDDNLLKFSEINTIKPNNVLRHHFDMVVHISNIRSIFSLRLATTDESSDKKKWLIFSAGGRAQICVTEIQIDQQQNLQFHEICDFMLRSSDLDRKRNKQTQIIYFDPETRFMSLVAYFGKNDINLVGGCSDGFIRTFKYANGTISLDTSTFYGRCFLNVYHFKFNGCNYLITMATDGLIAFWSLDNFNENSQPFFNVQHHDSGINSFDIFIDSNEICIATGGDDQAIVISVLQIEAKSNNEINISVSKTIKFPFNHTAQVNGVKFSVDQKYLYSVSVDQTIMRVDLSDFYIRQIGYSCISDAKGLQIVDLERVLVYGCGLQALKV
ncbi:WD repeat-containing protein 6 [Sitodiplosis mosellana]|uniref:WD repeat-containing protein 6 n=1 Tax=Sitodiplosis mosellana TaxID=263140 RepID=UPI0024452A65|nr:WD repeat-containing protein 6 [Sitodiplosis mosellana]XP_055297345.1 WD repeat-containing protein 6 [Sitodiplosis mosellana]